MRDKILIWIDPNLIYFGLAKFLQEKIDADFYTIAETTTLTKQFLQKQQSTKFDKIWFFHDHISLNRRKPDVTYLRNFEKKYQIDLWLLAYNERIFFQYNEYHQFTSDEVLSILEQECKLFESILDEINPNFLLMGAPNYHYNYLLSKMCKSRGIINLLLGPSRFGGRSMISQEIDKMDSVMTSSNITYRSHDELLQYLKGYNVFSENEDFKKRFIRSKSLRLVAALKFLFSSNDNIKNNYTYLGRTKLKILYRAFIWLIKERWREFFINKLKSHVDNTTPFIYFPLQIDIESTLLIGAPFHTNQIELVKHIVKSLPVGYKLYVKDHPLQNSRGWRSTSYYKQIMNLPNVELLHPSTSPDEIIKKSSLVITIASTAGLEAAFHNKPSIVFADVAYSMLPSVYRLNNIDELPKAIRTSLEKTVNDSDLSYYVDLIDKNSFEFSLSNLFSDYDDYFFYGGFLVNVDIDETMMNTFLENNRIRFDKLVQEHIKKIKQHQNNVLN